MPHKDIAIRFIKAGKYKSWKRKSPSAHGILDEADDWQLCFDLPEYTGDYRTPFIMPHSVVISPLKVDLLIISNKLKYVVFCELTCPNETNLFRWQKAKRDKYAGLSSALNCNWKCSLFTLEVSTKGYVMANSYYTFTKFLGLTPAWTRKLRDELSRDSLSCSYVI